MARQIISNLNEEYRPTARQRAFEQGVSMIGQGFGRLQQQEQTKRQQAFNEAQKLASLGLEVSPEEVYQERFEGEVPESGSYLTKLSELTRQREDDAATREYNRQAMGQQAQAQKLEQQNLADQRRFEQQKELLGMRQDQQRQLAKLKSGGTEKASPQGVLSGLSSESKNKVGALASGFQALGEMESAMKSGFGPEYIDPNTPLVGQFVSDTPFTQSERVVSEVIGRLQSGGAINDEERKSFIAMGPRPGDSPEMRMKKLANQRSFLENKLAAYGLKSGQLADLGFDVNVKKPIQQQVSIPENFQYAQVPGMQQAPAVQAPLAPVMGEAVAGQNSFIGVDDAKAKRLEELRAKRAQMR